MSGGNVDERHNRTFDTAVSVQLQRAVRSNSRADRSGFIKENGYKQNCLSAPGVAKKYYMQNGVEKGKYLEVR